MAADNRSETRSIDRAAEGPKPAAGAVTHRHGVGVVQDPGVSAQQVTQACGAAADSAKQANTALATFVKPEVQQSRPAKAKPGTAAFVQDMAALQEKYAAQLGHLNTDPAVMRARVATAQAADDAATPMATLCGQLGGITNANLDLARRDGSAVYRRAVAVADSYPDIAKAIAPYRDANSRDAKKGVATKKRKAKAGEGVAAIPQQQQTGKTTTTTVSTTNQT